MIRIDPFFSSKLFAVRDLQQRREASVAKDVETSGGFASARKHEKRLPSLGTVRQEYAIGFRVHLYIHVQDSEAIQAVAYISTQDIFGIFWLPHHSNDDLFFVKLELHEAIPDDNRFKTM